MRKIFILLVLSFSVLFSKAQDSCINHWETIIYSDNNWRYVVDSSFQDQDWQLVSFKDSLWNEGEGGIGYGDNDDKTVVPNCKILYLRKNFEIQDTAVICKALLSIDYDDAFVAWLNGAEIARAGVTDIFPDANSTVILHEAGNLENFVIHKDTITKYLIPGENLLSFQIHNESVGSSDLSSNIFFSIAVSSTEEIYGPLADDVKIPANFSNGFDLPLVVIETNGASINRDGKISADMKIMDKGYRLLNHPSDSANVYSGKIGIKTRGSSSSGFPQKSYTIETRDSVGENRNVPLLGMPKENDWLLTTNYYDRSFVRNYLSHEIFRGMGSWSPRVRHCEVILNGDYRGVYLLMETIKVDKDRLDLAKLGSEENSGDDVTGGYIIKNDNFSSDGKDSWKIQFPALPIKNWDAVNARFVYVYPDWDEITDSQKAYIQGYIETSKNVLYGSDFRNSVSGYYAYFDVLSFIDYFIISEVSRNGDSYKKSRFFHKDKLSKGGQLHAGPPWDFDWAWKNLFFMKPDGSGWMHHNENSGHNDVQPVRLMNRMLQDEYFANELYDRYFKLRETVLNHDVLSHKIDSIANYLSNAQLRHFDQWDILNGNSNDPDAYESESFEEEITYLKGWIYDRLSWLDQNMGDLLNENNFVSSPHIVSSVFFRVFPNPARDYVFIESNEPIDKIEVMTADGRVLLTNTPEGIRSTVTSIQSLNPGIYFVSIKIQNRVYIQKILKM